MPAGGPVPVSGQDSTAVTGWRSAVALRSPHDREIAALAIPALGALVADPVLSLVDTAFVGRVGSDELAALGVATAVFAVAFFAFNFLEYGTTALVARAVGAGESTNAGRSVVLAFLTAGVAGAGAILVLEVFTGPIAGALGAGGEVREAAVTYIRIRALAAPAVLVVRSGHGAFRGYQDTRTPLIVTLGINGINLVLDPILIFGVGWGIAGAAWATVAAQWIGAAWFLALLLGPRGRRLGIEPGRPDPAELWAFLRIGRDLAIRTGALLAAFTLASAVATRVSDTAIAAHQVVMQFWTLLALGLDAVAIAAQALVGRYLGERRVAAATAVADRIAALGAAVGVVMGFVVLAAGRVVPGWFTTDQGIVDAIGVVWPILALQQPLNAVVFAWDGVFIGAGDFAYLAVATAGAAAAAAVVFLLVLPLGWGLAGVWWAISALLAARFLTLAWRRVAPAGPLHHRR